MATRGEEPSLKRQKLSHETISACDLPNSAQVNEMIANAQRTINQRKSQLGFAVQNSTKLTKAVELQAQIAARMKNLGSLPSLGSSMPSVPTSALNLKLKGDNRHVTIDDKGRTVDAISGEVINLPHHVPTLKANMRAKNAQVYKKELHVAKKTVPKQNDSAAYCDSRIKLKPSSRSRRGHLQFNEPGKFIQMAQRQRTKATLVRLQASVSEAAKRTGIASAAKLATIQSKHQVNETSVPDVEWWDACLLKLEGSSGRLAYSILDSNPNVKDVLLPEWITNLVEHPIRMRPPHKSDKVIEIPLMLTKKERKKLRRQSRAETQKEKQELVRLGLAPPDEPKVRMANLMRVLGTEAVQDPSKIEAFVRAQMDKRTRAHEAANAARKLSKDQIRNKMIRKMREDVSHGVLVAVYRVKDLSNVSHKFKVEKNANQLLMTGFVASHKDCNVIVVEGGPKQQKKFKRLMLHRICWNDRGRQRITTTSGTVASGTSDSGNPSTSSNANCEASSSSDSTTHSSPCVLVWEGTAKRRVFSGFQFKNCPTELFAREQFKNRDVEQYWDLAYSGAVLEEAGE